MWRRKTTTIICAALMTIGFGLAQAATITVGPTGPPTYDYATIQAGINAAVDTDTVQVAAGTYVENVVWATKNLQVIGAGHTVCKVDGDATGSVFTISNVPYGARLEGFEVTNGVAASGSGLNISNSSLLVTCVMIAGNGAYPTSIDGGGVTVSGEGPTFTDNHFISNFASNRGPGLFAVGTDISLLHNEFISNRDVPVGTASGGGAYIYSSSIDVQDNMFVGNHVGGPGGGMYLTYAFGLVDHNDFNGNEAQTSGGGLHVGSGCSVQITRNLFRNNVLLGSQGGGVYIQRTSGGVTGLVNCLFTRNSATDGGGVYWAGNVIGNWTVNNCTIADNTGGGIDAEAAGVFVTNSILCGNTSGDDLSGVNADYCDFQHGAALGGANNMWQDPLFADPIYGDYRLRSTAGRWTSGDGWVTDAEHSPCIDAGDPAAPYVAETEDNGDRVNMGAYGNSVEASRSESSNRPPSAPVVDVTPDNPTSADDLTVTIVTESVDPEGATVIYRYRWYKDGVRQHDLDEKTLVPSSRTDRGEEWRCKVIPTDGTQRGDPDEDQVTVGNAPPSAPVVDVTPDSPMSWDDLQMTIVTESVDPDGDPVVYRYRWYQDGVRQRDLDKKATVPASRTSPGETWRCKVIPTDGTQRGDFGDDEVTVGNKLPRLSWLGTYGYEADGVERVPASPWDTFTWAVRYSDRDGDPAVYVRVHIVKIVGGVETELPGSPFDMVGVGADWQAGVEFAYTDQLTELGLYGYWFEAMDAWDYAKGTPARKHMRGPRVRDEFGRSPLILASAVALATKAGGAQVTFTMSAAGAVGAEVLNIAGRRVGTIVSDRRMEAGANTLSWNGRNGGGLPVPSGAYLIRLCVCDESGAQAQALTPVHIAR